MWIHLRIYYQWMHLMVPSCRLAMRTQGCTKERVIKKWKLKQIKHLENLYKQLRIVQEVDNHLNQSRIHQSKVISNVQHGDRICGWVLKIIYRRSLVWTLTLISFKMRGEDLDRPSQVLINWWSSNCQMPICTGKAN